ncbi:hypothetical protein V496_04895 [Pseudogymnoascus sp. VKM F-4515 (FW-2607)]|nr:hypothetical protein V496_04895 [Pseudogymnoascus sp. VKM F-4515 (FW-2607)]KFY89711.1 hypothetical protein V498_06316 [Pseudogymnoascus sp. VKM F-4517 (FW-2822)]
MPPRTCLITLGATAPFPALLSASLSPAFLSTLSSQGYTHLTLQCGADLVPAQEWITKLAPTLKNLGLSVRAFGFQGGGLGEEMRECKADAGEGRRRGCVVSHAGAGTALDALRLSLPLILVPNPALLDNHQLELAKELDRMGYAVHGRLEDLSVALKESEERALREWSETDGGGGRGSVMDVVGSELGYEPEERREEEVRGVLD